MKKLNLDETWRLCLSMWRWIAKKIRKDSNLEIEELKEKWLKLHTKHKIDNECYFCEYNCQHGGVSALDECRDCSHCPGRRIDPKFSCGNDDYHYNYKPLAFYNKLVSLDRKRLAKKKK